MSGVGPRLHELQDGCSDPSYTAAHLNLAVDRLTSWLSPSRGTISTRRPCTRFRLKAEATRSREIALAASDSSLPASGGRSPGATVHSSLPPKDGSHTIAGDRTRRFQLV